MEAKDEVRPIFPHELAIPFNKDLKFVKGKESDKGDQHQRAENMVAKCKRKLKCKDQYDSELLDWTAMEAFSQNQDLNNWY